MDGGLKGERNRAVAGTSVIHLGWEGKGWLSAYLCTVSPGGVVRTFVKEPASK